MPKISIKYDKAVKSKTALNRSLKRSEFAKFHPEVLGLGDLSKDGEKVNSLVAVFDLEGFTRFCNQPDSHLVVPMFIRKFLTWIFSELSQQLLLKSYRSDGVDAQSESVVTYGALPIYVKFLGDGILCIWDTDILPNPNSSWNITIAMTNVISLYTENFYKKYKNQFSRLPHKVRCGIAKGQVIGFDKRTDFVGSCINIAARLQKMPGLTFAVSARGYLLEESIPVAKKSFLVATTDIRGIGEDEIIFILKREYNKMDKDDKKYFRNTYEVSED